VCSAVLTAALYGDPRRNVGLTLGARQLEQVAHKPFMPNRVGTKSPPQRDAITTDKLRAAAMRPIYGCRENLRDSLRA